MRELLRKIVVPLVMFAIGTTASAQDKLLLLTQSNLGYDSQTWFYGGSGNELQEDEIQANRDEGRCITPAAHTTKGWFVTMAKNTGLTYQTYHYGSEWPGDWLEQKRNEDCYITTIASNRTKWFVVMSLNSGDDRQRYFRNSSFDEIDQKIRKQWNDGYSIPLLEFGAGQPASPVANNTTSNPGNTGNSWRQQLPNGGYCDYTRNADGSYSTLTAIPCTWCHGSKNSTICNGTGGVMGYGGIWYPCGACS